MNRNHKVWVWVAIAVWLLFGLSLTCDAQERSNTHYAAEYRRATVGENVAAAQNECHPSAAVPCYVVIDAVMASMAEGTMPAKCAQCYWLDYRTGGPGGNATSNSYFYLSPSFRHAQILRATRSTMADSNWGLAGSVGTPNHIAIIGDSIWSYYTQSFRMVAQQYAQTNAIGFTQFYGNVWGNDFATFTVPGGCAGTRNDTASASAWGISGTRVDCSGSQTITVQPNSLFPFSNFHIWYNKTVGGGTFTYSIDGGAASSPTDTNVAGADQLGQLTVTGIGLGNHTIVIATTGAVRLYGIDMWADRGGNIYHVLQSGASTASAWNGRVGYTAQFLAAMSPSMLDVELGVNDFAGGRSCSQVMSDVGAMVSQLALPVTTPVVRETWWWRGNPPGTEDTVFHDTVAGCRKTMLADAAANDYSVFDLTSYWPTYNNAWNYGLYYAADVIHPSMAGAMYKNAGLASALFGQSPSDSNFWTIWGGQLSGDANALYHNSTTASAVLDKWGGTIPASVYCRASNDTGAPSTRTLLQCLSGTGAVTIQLDGSGTGTIAVGTNTSIVNGGIFFNADQKARISGGANGDISVDYNTAGSTSRWAWYGGTATEVAAVDKNGKGTFGGGVAVDTAGNISITTGTGVPTAGNCTASTLGALYLNKSGGASTSLYVCTAAGVWTAK
jgi:hypothetical protein